MNLKWCNKQSCTSNLPVDWQVGNDFNSSRISYISESELRSVQTLVSITINISLQQEIKWLANIWMSTEQPLTRTHMGTGASSNMPAESE